MGITGDRYVAEYEGHAIELVRDNWVKMLTLRIHGQDVASDAVMFPHNITLTAVLEHNGVQHTITGKSLVHRIIFTKDSIEVDDTPLSVTKTQ